MEIISEKAKYYDFNKKGGTDWIIDLFEFSRRHCGRDILWGFRVQNYFWCPLLPLPQEKSRVAKQHNALVRSKSSEQLAQATQNDGQLVPHRDGPQFPDFSGLADRHYAIAERVVEEERQKCPNWMQAMHQQFEKDHGQLIQLEDCDGDDRDSDLEEDDFDVDGICPIDLCARDAERMDHHSFWAEQFKAVLRIARQSRKTKGFLPDHPLVIVLPNEMKDLQALKCGDACYLLSKIQFSPFDATLVKLTLERLNPGTDAATTWVAKMQPTPDGLPEVFSLDLFLKQCCQSIDADSHSLHILRYCGRKFGALDIDSVEDLEEATLRNSQAAAQAADDESEDNNDDDQKLAKKRSDLLRNALAAAKDGKPRRAKAKCKPRAKAVRKVTK